MWQNFVPIDLTNGPSYRYSTIIVGLVFVSIFFIVPRYGSFYTVWILFLPINSWHTYIWCSNNLSVPWLNGLKKVYPHIPVETCFSMFYKHSISFISPNDELITSDCMCVYAINEWFELISPIMYFYSCNITFISVFPKFCINFQLSVLLISPK